VTIAMSLSDEPYLATLSHGYDENRNCVYFTVPPRERRWRYFGESTRLGQALEDNGYQQGSCDHLYRTTQFYGGNIRR